MVKTKPSGDFTDVFAADQAMIYAFVRSLIPNHSDAEEIFQQVSMTLWKKRESFDPALGTFRAWAIGVARNHIRNFARRKFRENSLQVFAPDVLDRIAVGWRNRDDTWLERQDALKGCVGKLPPPDRQRLERYYGGVARPKEMAEAEDISLRTFYRKVQKLRKILLDCIAKAMRTEGGVHGRI